MVQKLINGYCRLLAVLMVLSLAAMVPMVSGRIEIDDATIENATMSIGISSDHDIDGRACEATDSQALMHRADIAMYQAKKGGKNRYSMGLDLDAILPRLTRDQAKELIACFWVKVNNHPAPPKVGVTAKESGTYNDFTQINLGGLKTDGSDGCGELAGPRSTSANRQARTGPSKSPTTPSCAGCRGRA